MALDQAQEYILGLKLEIKKLRRNQSWNGRHLLLEIKRIDRTDRVLEKTKHRRVMRFA